MWRTSSISLLLWYVTLIWNPFLSWTERNGRLTTGRNSFSESPKPPLRSRQKAETNEVLLSTYASSRTAWIQKIQAVGKTTWAETFEEREKKGKEKRQKKDRKREKRTNRLLQAVRHWKKNLPTGNALSVIGWTSAWQPNPVTRRRTRGCPSRDSGPLRKGHCQLRPTLFLFDDFVAVWIVESRWV